MATPAHSSEPGYVPFEKERLFKLAERRCRKWNANTKITAAALAGHPTRQNAAALHSGPRRMPGPVWKPLYSEDLDVILKPWVTIALKMYSNMPSWEQR
ncbi:hypothetical protein MTO96_024321 [Rhipicephalus appendiculatus]